MAHCGICKRELDTFDPLTRDCGGDCLKCMALVGEDPDCVPEVMFRSGWRAGVLDEGGGAYEHMSESMRAREDEAWAARQRDAK